MSVPENCQKYATQSLSFVLLNSLIRQVSMGYHEYSPWNRVPAKYVLPYIFICNIY